MWHTRVRLAKFLGLPANSAAPLGYKHGKQAVQLAPLMTKRCRRSSSTKTFLFATKSLTLESSSSNGRTKIFIGPFCGRCLIQCFTNFPEKSAPLQMACRRRKRSSAIKSPACVPPHCRVVVMTQKTFGPRLDA